MGGRHEMRGQTRNLVVIGQGAAGLAAALTAAEQAHGNIAITVIDKAQQAEAGGNTRWSPSNMRMASPEQVEPSFVHDMLTATQFRGDESYFARLAADAPATVKWLLSHGIEFIQPPYYLSKGPTRIQPVGGGANLIKVLKHAAKKTGVTFRCGCVAREIVATDGAITGVVIELGSARETLPADAIVLACGGFQGNPAMIRTCFGDRGEGLRLISPRPCFSTA